MLVNNAGGQYFVPAEAIALKGWHAVWRLNVGGTVLMTRAAVERAMRAAGGGMIVNVTLSPHHGLAGMTHSSAARAAVEGYTRELAREFAADGIAVSRSPPATSRPTRSRSTPSPCGGAPPAPCRCSASAASASTPGSSRSSPRRSAARSPARWSRSTAPATTGTARGRRPMLDASGDVPTEERRPAA